MKKLKKDVLEFVGKNKRVKDDIADLFLREDGARPTDLTLRLWIKKNDPRLTCISALEVISTWIDKPVEELTTEQ